MQHLDHSRVGKHGRQRGACSQGGGLAAGRGRAHGRPGVRAEGAAGPGLPPACQQSCNHAAALGGGEGGGGGPKRRRTGRTDVGAQGQGVDHDVLAARAELHEAAEALQGPGTGQAHSPSLVPSPEAQRRRTHRAAAARPELSQHSRGCGQARCVELPWAGGRLEGLPGRSGSCGPPGQWRSPWPQPAAQLHGQAARVAERREWRVQRWSKLPGWTDAPLAVPPANDGLCHYTHANPRPASSSDRQRPQPGLPAARSAGSVSM